MLAQTTLIKPIICDFVSKHCMNFRLAPGFDIHGSCFAELRKPINKSLEALLSFR